MRSLPTIGELSLVLFREPFKVSVSLTVRKLRLVFLKGVVIFRLNLADRSADGTLAPFIVSVSLNANVYGKIAFTTIVFLFCSFLLFDISDYRPLGLYI